MLLELSIFFYTFSMMLLDGHRRNIIRMTNSLVAGRSKPLDQLQFNKMVRLCILDLYGMKPLVTTLMLLLGFTMMEIQVYFYIKLTTLSCVH